MIYRWDKKTDRIRKTTVEEGGRAFVDDDRVVKKTMVGNQQVSTVFLEHDLSFGMGGGPILFESMIFGDGPFSEMQERYRTLDEARDGHASLVESLREARLAEGLNIDAPEEE